MNILPATTDPTLHERLEQMLSSAHRTDPIPSPHLGGRLQTHTCSRV